MSEPTATVADDPEPITVEEAIERLDDEAFVGFVIDLWERRGWTVRDRRRPDARHVDVLFERGWPEQQLGLVRIVRPSSGKAISGSRVQHFVGDLQNERIDWGRLVTSDDVPESVRKRGRAYDVEIRDRGGLAESIRDSDAYDAVALRIDPPVDRTPRETVPRIIHRIRSALEEYGVEDRLVRELERRLPEDPGARDVSRLVFAWFEGAYVLSLVLLVLVTFAATGSIVFLLLLGAFLAVVYLGLLPLSVADVYLLKQSPDPGWTPEWWYLVGFLLGPLALVGCGIYWLQRRRLTTDGWSGPKRWRS